jgi:hypothetical protein
VNIACSHLDWHTGSVQWASADTERVHGVGGVVFCGGLKGCPATYTLAAIFKRIVVVVTHMIPGATALTLIPFGACCCAKPRVKVAMAPLVDA